MAAVVRLSEEFGPRLELRAVDPAEGEGDLVGAGDRFGQFWRALASASTVVKKPRHPLRSGRARRDQP